jgi:hypothetical protein
VVPVWADAHGLVALIFAILRREKVHFDHPTLPQFGFGNQTSKPNIFDHPNLKTVLMAIQTIGHREVLMGSFNFFIYNSVLRT